jgi:hypothetical protein
LPRLEEKIINLINQNLEEFLFGLNEQIVSMNMLEAEKRLNHLCMITKLTGISEYLNEQILQKIEIYKNNKNDLMSIEKFKTYDLRMCALNSKKAFESLGGVNASGKFGEILTELETIITEKFLERLELAKQQIPVDLNDKNLKLCEQYVNDLPDDWKVSVSLLIKQCREKMQDNIIDDISRVESSIVSYLNNLKSNLKSSKFRIDYDFDLYSKYNFLNEQSKLLNQPDQLKKLENVNENLSQLIEVSK